MTNTMKINKIIKKNKTCVKCGKDMSINTREDYHKGLTIREACDMLGKARLEFVNRYYYINGKDPVDYMIELTTVTPTGVFCTNEDCEHYNILFLISDIEP